MCAKADRVVFLGRGSGENHDLCAKGAGELHAHVAEATETHDANLLARADFPVAQRRIGGDAGAQQGRGVG